jgi:hypothetical protein
MKHCKKGKGIITPHQQQSYKPHKGNTWNITKPCETLLI